jgi:hypothetical protein
MGKVLTMLCFSLIHRHKPLPKRGGGAAKRLSVKQDLRVDFVQISNCFDGGGNDLIYSKADCGASHPADLRSIFSKDAGPGRAGTPSYGDQGHIRLPV